MSTLHLQRWPPVYFPQLNVVGDITSSVEKLTEKNHQNR